MRFMMQSSILTKGECCDGASNILEGFISPINATVYERCIGANLSFVGLVAPYELGTDAIFDEDNELDAAVQAILEDRCDVVFCNDTFGRVARQAAERGLFFLQGEYGSISRYGVMALVSSMDRVGVLCRSIGNGVKVLGIISGSDGKDAVCNEGKNYEYSVSSNDKLIPFWCVDKDVKYADILSQIFYILASAEISNNISRYDGVKYGYRTQNAKSLEELYVRSRSKGLGKELKLLSVVGCMVLQKENYSRLYYKATQLRRLIRDYYSSMLDEHGILAFSLNEMGKDRFERLAATAISSLCGFPSVYASYMGKPCLLISKSGNEKAVFSLWKEEIV